MCCMGGSDRWAFADTRALLIHCLMGLMLDLPRTKGFMLSLITASVAALAVLVVVFLVAGVLTKPTWLQLHYLELHGRKVQATLNAIDRTEHNTCYVSFVAAGRQLSFNEPCGTSGHVKYVSVVYDPNNPKIAVVGSPSEKLTSALVVLAIAIAGVWIVVLVGMLRVIALVGAKPKSKTRTRTMMPVK